ncbi:MAG: hypothetical protein NTX64_16270 [Elusimicrobia bacterium]|nr:hypothetical protein [Elusimicrobiota bacterium]
MGESKRSEIERLTKEAVINSTVGGRGWVTAVAEVVRMAVVSGAASGRPTREVVLEACHGAVLGLRLVDKDLPEPAAAIIAKLAEAAEQTHSDLQDMLTWTAEGLAKASPDLPGENDIREAIDEKFLGVGELFDRFRDEKRKSQ